jgi:hypothetical protein
VFAENYNEKDIDSYASSATIIPLSGSNTIEIILPGKIEISELGAYTISTADELDINEKTFENVKGNKRPGTAKWLYILLMIGILAVYTALQEWYKKRYESFLFKDKNDLYNLINFIFNSRISRMKDGEIKKKLGSYNWKSEQMSYAFKKLDGKRTGMWEIPIFKFIENRRVKNEIEKRRQQQNMGGERFIKSHY